MAFTLIVNPGSSSKKFALYKERSLLIDAYIERVDSAFKMCAVVGGIRQKCETLDEHSFGDSLSNFLELCVNLNLISDVSDISKTAVRVVAPGTYFQAHRLVNDEYVQKLKKLSLLAPLHVPHILQEIEVVKKFLPTTTVVAASDSAFHCTIPPHIRQYSINREDSEKYDIYHFGYHGLSVASVMRKLKQVTPRKLEKVIVCHIGSGVSVTAVKNGKSFDTTMGYAPGSGLIMSSRAGELPTGALLALMQNKNLKTSDALIYLQKNGGLLGLAGEADLRILFDRKAQGDTHATQAIDSFVYQIQKSIGAYAAALGGLDAVIFTATASERNSTLRALILNGLNGINIKFNAEKNDECLSRDGVISEENDAVLVAVVRTDEASEILLTSENFAK